VLSVQLASEVLGVGSQVSTLERSFHREEQGAHIDRLG
jgi:hypothetical protein